MNDWLDINRKLWDGRVPVHVKSDFYDVGKFLEGGTSLTKIEPGALGSEVAGKKCSISNAILGWTRCRGRGWGRGLQALISRQKPSSRPGNWRGRPDKRRVL